MKVVIACLNSKYIHASLSPWCLAAGVDAFSSNSFEACVMESTINKDVSEIAEKIINKEIPFLTSVALCLEDSISDDAVEDAEQILAGILKKISESGKIPSKLSDS